MGGAIRAKMSSVMYLGKILKQSLGKTKREIAILLDNGAISITPAPTSIVNLSTLIQPGHKIFLDASKCDFLPSSSSMLQEIETGHYFSGDTTNSNLQANARNKTRVFALYKPKNTEITLTGKSKFDFIIKNMVNTPSGNCVLEPKSEVHNVTNLNNIQNNQSNSIDNSWYDKNDEVKDQDKQNLKDLKTIKASDRWFYIGRLDKLTTGLLFVTNDGDLSNYLCQPKQHWKTYHAYVRTSSKINHSVLQRLKNGVELNDGMASALVKVIGEEVMTTHILTRNGKNVAVKITNDSDQDNDNNKETSSSLFGKATKGPSAVSPISVNPIDEQDLEKTIIRKKYENCLEVHIDIGRNRIVRRLLASVGLNVYFLKRVAVANVSLQSCGLQSEGDFVELDSSVIESELWGKDGRRSVYESTRKAMHGKT